MSSLHLWGVQDAGVPNKELIAIFVEEDCNLGNYCVLIGHQHMDGTATPIQDHMFWFGKAQVRAGDWIFIYTAPGKSRIEKIDEDSNVISVHWNKDKTVFQNRTLIPILCKLSEISFPPEPEPKSQTLLLEN